MPIQHATSNGLPGYRWGDQGTIYTYDPNSPESRSLARKQAQEQGTAIELNKRSQVSQDIFEVKNYYEEEQLVFGWASVAKEADGTRPIEWQGDEIEMDEMEPVIYDFVLSQGITKEMHRPQEAKGQIVESVVLTKQKMAAMGIPEGVVPEGWWVGFKIHDAEVFAKVRSGVYKMFSIEGQGVRTPYEEE